MASSDESYYGTWKIIEYVSLAGVAEITGIEGTEFVLDENGDVSWEVPEMAEPLPFFNCESYEVCPAAGTVPCVLKFTGTYAGYIVEFRMDISDDLMLLTYEKCCMLQCQKVGKQERKEEIRYSLFNALDQGFFSDIVIKADTGKEFKVHSTILYLTAPELDWKSEVPPLTGLAEDVLGLTLFFLYTECLPRGLSEATAQRCIKMVGKMPGFSRLSAMCKTFLENTALTQQIRSLIADIHKGADRINSLFVGHPVDDSSSSSPLPSTIVDDDDDDDDEYDDRTINLEGTVWTHPAKLCGTIRRAMREEAVATAKLVILCDLFARRKQELSREERHDIMKHIMSRIPIFLKQLVTLLKVIKTHLQALSQQQRNNIASYLVPEMETILDIMFRFANETKAILEQAITASHEKLFSKGGGGDKADGNKASKKNSGFVLGRSLKHALHMKELKRLKHFHERTTASFNHLRQKRDNFNMKSEAGKVRTVSQALVHLSDELPFFMMRLKEITSTLDEKVTWKEWKYIFKTGTSKVSWSLGKVQANKDSLLPMVDEICGIIRSEEFDASLVTLGLKAPLLKDPSSGSEPSVISPPRDRDNKPPKYAQLTNVESLCVSPCASKSVTASRALDLFRSGKGCDMIFEVITQPDLGEDIVIDHTNNKSDDCLGATAADIEDLNVEDGETKVVEFHAHRVIVAARCDRFRRALLSGMQESIKRKIMVHDISGDLFVRFLESLYSGILDTGELNVEQLADMMTLCDKYEMDAMKAQCESELKHLIDEENVLCLLNLADHLNGKDLRVASLYFIADHPDIVDCEMFEELPEYLKEMVQDAIDWKGLDPHSQPGDRGSGASSSTNPHFSGSNTSLSELDTLTTNMNLQDQNANHSLSHATGSNSSSSEDIALVEDFYQLENCIQALVDIVGEEVPREELERISIAADYDVNRALNYFFSS